MAVGYRRLADAASWSRARHDDDFFLIPPRRLFGQQAADAFVADIVRGMRKHNKYARKEVPFYFRIDDRFRLSRQVTGSRKSRLPAQPATHARCFAAVLGTGPASPQKPPAFS